MDCGADGMSLKEKDVRDSWTRKNGFVNNNDLHSNFEI